MINHDKISYICSSIAMWASNIILVGILLVIIDIAQLSLTDIDLTITQLGLGIISIGIVGCAIVLITLSVSGIHLAWLNFKKWLKLQWLVFNVYVAIVNQLFKYPPGEEEKKK